MRSLIASPGRQSLATAWIGTLLALLNTIGAEGSAVSTCFGIVIATLTIIATLPTALFALRRPNQFLMGALALLLSTVPFVVLATWFG